MKQNNVYPLNNTEKSMVLKAMDQLVNSAKARQCHSHWEERRQAEKDHVAKLTGTPKAKKLFARYMKIRNKAAALIPLFEKMGIAVEHYERDVEMRMSEAEYQRLQRTLDNPNESLESRVAQLRARVAIAYDRAEVNRLYEEAVKLVNKAA